MTRMASLFQSSPALSGRCNVGQAGAPGTGRVSILTGPFRPVQHRQGGAACSTSWAYFNPHRPFRAGATSWGFRQPPSESCAFQSSPALSGRCNHFKTFVEVTDPEGFQSSPALSGRCNSPLYRSPPDGQEGGPSRRPPSRDPRPGAWHRVPKPVFKLHHGLRRFARTPRGFCAHLGFAHCPHHRMYGPQSPHP